jgi:hypothetical protein
MIEAPVFVLVVALVVLDVVVITTPSKHFRYQVNGKY